MVVQDWFENSVGDNLFSFELVCLDVVFAWVFAQVVEGLKAFFTEHFLNVWALVNALSFASEPAEYELSPLHLDRES
jgi:hypothetical protein